jgi:hypothetical protein
MMLLEDQSQNVRPKTGSDKTTLPRRLCMTVLNRLAFSGPAQLGRSSLMKLVFSPSRIRALKCLVWLLFSGVFHVAGQEVLSPEERLEVMNSSIRKQSACC